MGKAASKICMHAVYCVFGSDTLHVSYLTLQTFQMQIFTVNDFQKWSYVIALALLMFVQL